MNKIIKIPSAEDCYKLMEEYEMFPNIIEHSTQVMNVSIAIINNLIKTVEINRDLVIASALLHDIAKTRSIKTGETRHDLLGGEMLRKLGMDDIAFIVESHVIIKNFSPEGPLEEREIVHYADKRVLHSSIVTIDERMDDIIVRYGKYIEDKTRIIKNRAFAFELENKIQNHLATSIDNALASIQ